MLPSEFDFPLNYSYSGFKLKITVPALKKVLKLKYSLRALKTDENMFSVLKLIR